MSESLDGTVAETQNTPDYSAVNLPSKDRTKYSYVERRAELLQLIEEVGHPTALNQTELADRYGVSNSQISKDLKRLGAHVHKRLVDHDRRAFTVDTVVNRSIRGLLDDEEYRKAAKTAMEYDEWIREFHDLEQMDERLRRIEERQERGEP